MAAQAQPLPLSMEKLSPKVFDAFKELIYRESGITLGPQKEALVASRLAKRMRALGMRSYEKYLDYVAHDTEANELVQLLDAISTNVTHFFREERHFDMLSRTIKEWSDKGQREFRIWCAASSTGEEPYSLAITLSEVLPPDANFKILASDISTTVLDKAEAAVYQERHVEKIDRMVLQRYFQKGHGKASGHYRVKKELRDHLTFRRLNLSRTPFPLEGPFDMVFCRNVMIYFDNAIRQGVLDQVQRLLRPGGYFVVGHSECMTGIAEGFKVVEPAVYRKQ
jgi:chemotaxis protein methyltransferase CheR